MPDITKCTGENCKLKQSCYRFTAEPNEFRQSYFTDAPIMEDKNCDYFWPNEDKKEKKRRAWHY